MEHFRMEDTDIVKAVMKETGTTQVALTQLLGYANQSAVSGRLNSRGLGVERFVSMLEAMGYEVVVRKIVKRDGSEDEVRGGLENSADEKEWVVAPGKRRREV